MTDPYQTLGVPKTASLDEIKKAYRKLAKNHHPDLNPANKQAEKKFKEISHAFDLIGTKEAKEKFDSGQSDEHQQHQYEQYRKANAGREYKGSQRYTSSFEEDFDADSIFANLFGGAGRKSAHAHSSGGINLPGEDVLYQMEVDFTEAALGGEKVITLPTGKKLQVKIPAGIESGKKLKFKGLGGASHYNGAAGDAYVQIMIKPMPGFTRVDQDIYTEVAISFFEAINGAEIEVPTIDGPIMLTIPPGVSSGSKLRIKNKGAGEKDARGNQIVTLKIVIPKTIPSDMKESLNIMAEKYAYNPRSSS